MIACAREGARDQTRKPANAGRIHSVHRCSYACGGLAGTRWVRRAERGRATTSFARAPRRRARHGGAPVPRRQPPINKVTQATCGRSVAKGNGNLPRRFARCDVRAARMAAVVIGFRGIQDTLPEWSKGVDSSSTSASCVGSNPTGVICRRGGAVDLPNSRLAGCVLRVVARLSAGCWVQLRGVGGRSRPDFPMSEGRAKL